MSGAVAVGTFAAPLGSTVGEATVTSDTVEVPANVTTMRLTLTGLDASNTAKTQKITAAGGAWADQITYNSDQASVAITVANGEQWRLVCVAQQANKEFRYAMKCES